MVNIYKEIKETVTSVFKVQGNDIISLGVAGDRFRNSFTMPDALAKWIEGHRRFSKLLDFS